MIFCLFVLNLLGLECSRVVRGAGERWCGIGLVCCDSWGEFDGEVG